MNIDTQKTGYIVDVSEDDSRKLQKASIIIDADDCDALMHWLDANADLLRYPVYNKYGHASLLHLAAGRGSVAMCRLLLRRGVDVNAFSPVLELFPYETPLVTAAREGQIDVTRLLCENGAWVDGHPRCNLTPLAAACVENHKGVAEYLLSRSPDLTRLHNRRHKTALDLAKTRSQSGIVELVVKSFETDSKNDSEDTARLLCLAPVKFPKAGPYKGEKLASWLNQRRYLRSGKLSLKME